MTRPVQHNHHQVVHPAVQALRYGLEVLLDGGIDVNRATAGRTDDDLFHVAVRGMEESALV